MPRTEPALAVGAAPEELFTALALTHELGERSGLGQRPMPALRSDVEEHDGRRRRSEVECHVFAASVRSNGHEAGEALLGLCQFGSCLRRRRGSTA